VIRVPPVGTWQEPARGRRTDARSIRVAQVACSRCNQPLLTCLSLAAPRSEASLMRLSRRLPMLVAVASLLAACAGGSATGSPQSSGASPAATSTAWLRATTFQAGPLANPFAAGPTAVITADGTFVTAGPVDAKDPQPLLPNLVGRSLSDAGRAAILTEAARLGLLGSRKDFRGVAVMPGGVVGRLQLTVDGSPVTLVGEPDSKLLCIPPACDPLPGTPEAFGEMWRKIADPVPWLAAELGPETPFTPAAYALLVGPAPASDPAHGASIADWPLAMPLATFGRPVANGNYRCGTVSGVDADTLRPALERASRQTQWVQDPATSATFGILVRPIIAGEDPCAEAFGG